MVFDLRDKPIDSLDFDLLDTGNYSDAISKFILHSSTPMTISVQGEWGCGKTSLMKMIEKNVCDNTQDKYFESIWINTWEFFVNNNSDNACEQIILYILREITKRSPAQKSGTDIEDLKKNLKRYFSSVANIAMDVAGVSDETKHSTIDIFSDVRLTTVSQLRTSIETTIGKLVQNQNGLSDSGFVFFIDDLDRIDPENAIRILEILKNLFDIDHCVFVLAIDYDVITRGLQKKYGEFDKKSEVAYRAYFDKLIQLPFSMPIKNYDPTEMIKQSLGEIQYFKDYHVKDQMYRKLGEIVRNTINNNPRSWKRVVNSLFLSDIIDQKGKNILDKFENRLMNFVFVVIQIGYPKVYSYMLSFPDLFIAYLTGENDKFLSLLDDQLLDIYGKDKLNNVAGVFSLLKSVAHDFGDTKEIILTSATTSLEEDMKLEVKYDGELYNQSSQTQFRQGINLIEKVSLKAGSDILDIGCGNGKTTIELYQTDPTVNIKAFDYSESQVEVACANRSEANIPDSSIDFYQMNALDLNEKEQYDLIFSNAALHWITDSKNMYAKIYTALKNGGSLAIHQGGKDSYRELHEMALTAANTLGMQEYFDGWLCPLFYPTKQEMERLLFESGFTNVQVVSEESQGSEYVNLIDNFANASLIPYLDRVKTVAEQELLKETFKTLAKEQVTEVYTHRLYIFADKE